MKTLKLVAVLLVLVLILAAWWFFEKAATPSTMPVQSSALKTGVNAPAPEGYILLNVTPVGENTEYLSHENVGLLTFHESATPFFTPRSSSDGSVVVGIAASSTDLQQKLGLWEYNVATHAVTQLISIGTGIRLPTISSKGIIAFNELNATTSASQESAITIPESWEIWLFSPVSGLSHLTDGLFPQWSPDGSSLLYLASDGIHLRVISSGADTLVWPMQAGSVATSRMMLSLSKDGREIVWTDPDRDTLIIALVDSWQPFSAHIIQTVKVDAFWPVISPDDAYVAFEQFDWQTSGAIRQPINPRLSIVQVSDGAITELQSLAKYDPTKLFISDWNDSVSL